MNQTFLALAGIINIYNWISFGLWLRVFDEESTKRNKLWLFILNIITPIFWTIILVTYLSFFTATCAHPSTRLKNDDALYAINIALFAFLGVSFIFATLFLKYKLKLWNEEIEKLTRMKISFAAHILTIPFLLRAIFNLMNICLDVNEKLSQSISDNTWLASIVYFVFIIISDLIPMTSQIASMLVVVDERDFSNNVRSTQGDTGEGKN